MIKHIEYIKGMAVFEKFVWRDSLRDKGNNLAIFKNINIIYGRNYSGKTTLSRVFRAFETGVISDKYGNPEFSTCFDDGTNYTEKQLLEHDKEIRVFNEDFVKKNLKFIVNEGEGINSFAVLGDKNNELEDEIDKLQEKIGVLEENSGMYGVFKKYKTDYEVASRNYLTLKDEIEHLLREKANNSDTGIKHNKIYGNANYNIQSIRKDLDLVIQDSYVALQPNDLEKAQELLGSIEKRTIPTSQLQKINLSLISVKAKELIEKNIKVSDPIQELLSDALLAKWAYEGIKRHKDIYSKCGFCGGELPKELWEKLDRHFDQEAKELESAIDQLLLDISKEKERSKSLFSIKPELFYSKYNDELQLLDSKLQRGILAYNQELDKLESQLNNRKENLLISKDFQDINFSDDIFLHIESEYERLREASNKFSENLAQEQTRAKEALRLNEVCKFSRDIDYLTKVEVLETAREEENQTKKTQDEYDRKIQGKLGEIFKLKAKLKDESKGAEKINEYLNGFFGNNSLSLKAIEIKDEEGIRYSFDVIRNNKKAYHLSEGECSLIAFCYFMAKLDDIHTRGKKVIIWIDDPICSLDSNHIFFVYSLINSEIVGKNIHEQLFISTHNLDFLKYLKRLPRADNNKHTEYFLLNRTGNISDIKLMPQYMREYVTEFNFLFHQIYKCAALEQITDENYMTFYNFGNNARKFLEIYLYYKYPDGVKDSLRERLSKFFNEDQVAVAYIERVNNELSHLSGVFERGATLLQSEEMKKVALAIITRLKEKDEEQYFSLLKSINEEDIL